MNVIFNIYTLEQITVDSTETANQFLEEKNQCIFFMSQKCERKIVKINKECN